MEKTYTEKLAKLFYILIIVTIAGLVCFRFANILMYVLLALVVAVLAAPISGVLQKIRIKGHRCPAWLSTTLAMVILFALFSCLILVMVPLIRNISQDISMANVNSFAKAAALPFANVNETLIRVFPTVGPGFRFEDVLLSGLGNVLDFSDVSSVVGSVTSFIVGIGVTIFSVLFISFFFIKDPDLFHRIVMALVPDNVEAKVTKSLSEIRTLVTRYFVGITIEVAGVALINFLGLFFIARMGVRYSLGIAFITGVLNIIPYLGPLIGGIIGVSLSVVIRYACATPFGISVPFAAFVLILIAIFTFTQLIDNYVYQPLIYSNSVKVHPLEIFIVFLIAGSLGGFVGMLVAIPGYTVLRVIAKEFLGDVKPIRRLTGDGTRK